MVADVIELDPIWKALADPTRRALLDLVRERPCTTGELTAAFEPSLSRFAVMKHLGVLEGAGLVVTRRQGRHVWYYLNAIPLQQMYERWVRPYEASWASSLLQLRQHVEDTSQVTEVHMQEFQIDQEFTLAAAAPVVYRALTEGIDAWWAMRSDGAAVVLEPRAGGRFFEQAHGSETLWATVTRVQPDEALELSGPMGMPGVVLNTVTYTLTADGDSTRLRLSHHALGAVEDTTRTEYVGGWEMLLGGSLKSHVESTGGRSE